MHHSATPTTITPAPPAPTQPLLRTDVRSALQHGIPRLQAQGVLIEALYELHMVHINDADSHQPEQFHQAFVLILNTALALHTSAEDTVLEHMTHALRIHYTKHDRVAHALVSAWSAVELRDPAGLVIDLLDVLALDAAPLPVWVSHLLQLLPRTGLSHGAVEGLRQVRQLLQPRLGELAPARLDKTLQRLEADPDLMRTAGPRCWTGWCPGNARSTQVRWTCPRRVRSLTPCCCRRLTSILCWRCAR